MTRELLRRSFDARQVPAILARPSGGVQEALVVRAEIDELIADVTEKINLLRNDSQTADTTIRSDFQAIDADLQRQIDQLASGVAGQAIVAGMVETMAEATGAIPGVSGNSPDDWHSWFLVVAEANPANAGIYYKDAGGNIVRVPRYSTVENFPASFQIYVDSVDRKYVVRDEPIPVSATNNAIASASIIPWTRVEELIANAPIEKIANALNLRFNAEIFAVVEGQLDFSADYKQQQQALADQVAANQSDIGTAQGNIAANANNLSSLSVRIDDADLAIATQTDQISALQSADATIQNRLTTAESDLADIDAAVTDAQATIAAHGGRLDTAENDIAGKLDSSALDTRLNGFLSEIHKPLVLTGGVTTTQQFDGINYYTTTFTLSTGYGDANFRMADLSRTAAPYEKITSYLQRRSGVDSLQIVFQSSQGVDQNGTIVAQRDGELVATVIRVPALPVPAPEPAPAPAPEEVEFVGSTLIVRNLAPNKDFRVIGDEFVAFTATSDANGVISGDGTYLLEPGYTNRVRVIDVLTNTRERDYALSEIPKS
jgi:hypothetical protein